MMLQNLGKSLRATVMAVCRQGIVFMPLILLLPRLFGLTGALAAQPVSDLISCCIGFPMVLSQIKELRAMQTAPLDSMPSNRKEKSSL